MTQLQGISSSEGGRLDGSLQKITLAATDFTLGAGWGASTKVLTTGSTDQRGQLVITAVTGGGLAQATATVVLAFADGAYTSAPFVIVTQTNDSSIDTGRFTWSSTTTAVTFTLSVAPVNTKIYKLNYMIIA